jgi:Fe-S cluster assembly iron-binding protein IscA
VLELTLDASQAIERLLSDPDVPDGAGIRIESAGSGQSTNGAHAEATTLRLVVAPGAPDDDQIVESGRARVFIEPELAAFHDDKLLDIAIDGASVEFTLAERP